jgi:translation initiation factor IF-3
VRVVGAQGEQLGVLSIEAALERAQTEGLDLVEVNPMSKPPVCKIMDYGRFKYEEKKKANEAKKKQIVIKVKEVKLRPKTEEHDYDFKIRNVKSFLEEGHKAKITIMFRGREITHRELGQAVLDDVIADTKDIAVIETPPRMEGRQMFMIIAPNSKTAQRARDAHRQQAIAHDKERQEHRHGGKEGEHKGEGHGGGHGGGGHGGGGHGGGGGAGGQQQAQPASGQNKPPPQHGQAASPQPPHH